MDGRMAADLADRIGRQLYSAICKNEAGDAAGAVAAYDALDKLTENPSEIASFRLFGTACMIEHGQMRHAYERFSTIDPKSLGLAHQFEYEYLFARLLAARGEYDSAKDRVEQTLQRIAQSPGYNPLILMTARKVIVQQNCLLAATRDGKVNETWPAR